MKPVILSFVLAASVIVPAHSQQAEPYLTWTADQALKTGKAMVATGRVGGVWDTRVVHTESAINYKLRATWLTPEVIRAAARLEQLRSRLSDEQTRALVDEADLPGQTVFLVEIDPNEGSGVIPLDWRVFLQPKGAPPGGPNAVPGTKSPAFRNIKALAGVMPRNYDYDRFWVSFPVVNEKNEPLIPPSVQEVELIVGIYNKEGRATWRVPSSIRERITALTKTQTQKE
ncbi:MAG TPA: hypothetical protein VJH03_12645 [Blastocatellia bacterium]|nr:hypothetical protein [Blastocatellia bacterium]